MLPPVLRAGLGALSLAVASTLASAQDAAAPAQGFTMWIRSGGGSVQELAGSVVGSPQLAVGRRRDRNSIAIGVGIARIAADRREEGGSSSSEETARATLVQVGPELLHDVWRSPDGRVRGNLSGGVGIGRLMQRQKSTFTSGSFTSEEENTLRGTLVTLRLGLGGEYFMHSNFALGFEGGVRGTSARNLKRENDDSRSSFGIAGTYTALRAQVVF